MRILITGDTHGNLPWLSNYIIPVAEFLDADLILVLGDFGYWEHTLSGVSFLDRLDERLSRPLYWLHGNHDKHSLALRRWGDARDAEGFVRVREQILYIPQGHAWTWSNAKLRSFGGAYSVDKTYRLRLELKRYAQMARSEQNRANSLGVAPRPVPSQSGTLWFPEEEMSDTEMERLLAADHEIKDVVFSHDKPRNTKPLWGRKDIPLCEPNQLRLQRALEAHRPYYWFHGHLHFRYNFDIAWRDRRTTVVGLAPDEAAREDIWHREQTWSLLDIDEAGGLTVTNGDALDQGRRTELYKQIFSHQ